MLMLKASSIFYLFYLCLEDCLIKTRNNHSLQHFHHLIILAVLVSKNVHFFSFSSHIDHLTHIIYESKVVPVAAMCLPWSAKMWGEIFGEGAVTSLATHITRHKGTDFQRPD